MISRCLAALVAVTIAFAATSQVPERPDPPRLVNDFAGVLGDTRELEDSLEAFAMRTSNQITVVTLNDLGDYAPSMLAYEIGEKWGVGGKKHSNGVVLLIKPKTATRGQTAIATGYGLEAVLTDAVCRRIIETQLIPAFKQNDYKAGVWAAVNTIMPLASGEISEKEFLGGSEEEDPTLGFIILIIVFLVWAYFRFGNDHHDGSSGTWGGFWGEVFSEVFTGGGGGGRGGGSSWGGFGGGSFGGGGASGSW